MYLFFVSFLALPCFVRSGERRPGPASRTLYRVNHCDLVLDPDLGYTSSFQSELSQVHSDMFFLKPNALVLSALEEKPVLGYFDQSSYAKACQLYSGPIGPLEDLDICCPFRTRSWARTYRQEGLIR